MENEVISEKPKSRRLEFVLFIAPVFLTVCVTLFLCHKLEVEKSYIKGQAVAWKQASQSLKVQNDIEMQQIVDKQEELKHQLIEFQKLLDKSRMLILENKVNSIIQSD